MYDLSCLCGFSRGLSPVVVADSNENNDSEQTDKRTHTFVMTPVIIIMLFL